jgi:hypothetical protein
MHRYSNVVTIPVHLSSLKGLHSGSVLSRTSIERNDLAIDPLAFLARQKTYDSCNIDRIPIPRQGGSMCSHLVKSAIVSRQLR